MERYGLLNHICQLLDDANVPYTYDECGDLDFICDDINYLTKHMDTAELYDVIKDVHRSLYE